MIRLKIQHMNYLLTLLIISCCTSFSWSQEEEVHPPPVEQPKEVAKPPGPDLGYYMDPDPEFPGGTAALRQYIVANLVYPETAKQKGIGGKCYLKFLVSTEGKVTHVTVTRGVPDCPECDAEAVRVISAMPNWKPAKLNGKPVATNMNLPVTFDPKP